MDEGELSLIFNETVNASSLDINGITFISTADFPVEVYTLRESTFSLSDNTFVVVFLIQEDLDEIKLSTNLATNENNTFLNLSDSLIQDMSGSLFFRKRALWCSDRG